MKSISHFILVFQFISVWFRLESQTVYFFKDGNNPGFYDSGLTFKTSPSTIEQAGTSGDKIPTSSTIFFEGSNSLKLRWTSKSGGDWQAYIIAPGFPFQDITITDSISMMVWAPDGLLKSAMPKIYMEAAPGTSKTKKYNLSDYNNDIPANKWIEIKFPLNVFFNDPGNNTVDFKKTKAIILTQNIADNTEHTIYLDNVKTFRPDTNVKKLTAPTHLTAQGYDSHIELNWVAGENASKYEIWISTPGKNFTLRKTVESRIALIDFVRDLGENVQVTYKIRAIGNAGDTSAYSNEATASISPMSDSALLTMIQRYTFRYFWEYGHPVSGMAKERNTTAEVVTTGGTGFGIAAMVVATDRGFITRSEAVARLNKIVNFLSKADRFHGVFPHWMNGTSGKVIPFNPKDDGGDLVETSFLIQGLLTAREYFNGVNAEESALRNTINFLWNGVEWDWHRKGNENVLYWHWSPNYEWQVNFPLRGYYEALITYLLAVASPTHPIPASIYHQGWAGLSTYVNGKTFYGNKLFVGPGAGGPLFFTHYSFIGFDPRNIKDRYANYFTQNVNQSLINWSYCKENPKKWLNYSADNWGLTASDDPNGYLAHEPLSNNDNGTISPTGALSSMPYTPQQSLAALKYFYRKEGDKLFGLMGFYDAYNPTRSWYADNYLAIDQGPIIDMIENYRTGLLWKYFMQSPEIKPALDAIGFTADVTPVHEDRGVFPIQYYPNPSHELGTLEFFLVQADRVNIRLYDYLGRIVSIVCDHPLLGSGKQLISIHTKNLTPGNYVVNLSGQSIHQNIKITKE